MLYMCTDENVNIYILLIDVLRMHKNAIYANLRTPAVNNSARLNNSSSSSSSNRMRVCTQGARMWIHTSVYIQYIFREREKDCRHKKLWVWPSPWKKEADNDGGGVALSALMILNIYIYTRPITAGVCVRMLPLIFLFSLATCLPIILDVSLFSPYRRLRTLSPASHAHIQKACRALSAKGSHKEEREFLFIALWLIDWYWY